MEPGSLLFGLGCGAVFGWCAHGLLRRVRRPKRIAVIRIDLAPQEEAHEDPDAIDWSRIGL